MDILEFADMYFKEVELFTLTESVSFRYRYSKSTNIHKIKNVSVDTDNYVYWYFEKLSTPKG